MKSRRCPKCDAECEVGFLVDTSRHEGVGRWASGEPTFYFLRVLRMKGRRRLLVESWRCKRCGYLESYAVEPAT